MLISPRYQQHFSDSPQDQSHGLVCSSPFVSRRQFLERILERCFSPGLCGWHPLASLWGWIWCHGISVFFGWRLHFGGCPSRGPLLHTVSSGTVRVAAALSSPACCCIWTPFPGHTAFLASVVLELPYCFCVGTHAFCISGVFMFLFAHILMEDFLQWLSETGCSGSGL